MTDSRNSNDYNCIVIIPTLNPDDKLKEVIDGVIEKGFKKILVVNDGSDENHMEPFEYAKTKPQCKILTHEVNRGKGCALKTAFKYVLENEPDCMGVITVDGDNQHKPDDILACVKLMSEHGKDLVLGCRDFSGLDLPLRSKIGNNITTFVFRRLCGVNISDTQTGLRAIPREYLNIMLEIDGDRYEYETNMLLALKKNHIPYRQQSIETVYIDDNESSHFNPVIDSIKIYGVIFKFMFSSIAASVIDISLFAVFVFIFGKMFEQELSILISTVMARIISSVFNCLFNKKAVFKSGASLKAVLVKYYILCICQTSISYFGVLGLTKLFGLGEGGLVVLIKVVVDTTLFFISYFIQKGWVYREDVKAKN